MTHPHRRRWVKLWTQEAIAGTTRHELDPAERSIWWDFLALAGDSMSPGVIQVAQGIAYTDEQLSTLLNVPMSLLQRARSKMVQHEKVTIENGCIIITNWTHYQGDYVRLQEYRNRVSTETPTPSVSNDMPRPEEEEEEEQKKSSGAAAPGRSRNFARVCELYENTMGTLTPTAAQLLDELALNYELAWIESAFKEAAAAGAKRLNYVIAVLERWGRDGYKAPRPKRYGQTAAQRRHEELPTGQQLEKEWAGREESR